MGVGDVEARRRGEDEWVWEGRKWRQGGGVRRLSVRGEVKAKGREGARKRRGRNAWAWGRGGMKEAWGTCRGRREEARKPEGVWGKG